MNQKTSILSLIVIAIIFLAASSITFNYLIREQNTAKIAKKFQEELNLQSNKLELALGEFEGALETGAWNKSPLVEVVKFDRLFETDGFVFVAFKDKKLIAYSDNHLPQLNYDSLFSYGPTRVLALQNGWYLPIYKKKGNFLYVGLQLIKNRFVFQNKFLENKFNNKYKLPKNTEIYSEFNSNLEEIKCLNLQQPFYLSIGEQKEEALTTGYPSFLYSIGLLLLIYALIKGTAFISRKKIFFVKMLLIIIVTFTVRWLTLNLNWFVYLNKSKLFDPSLYASSSYFPSLGDLLINAILFCLIAYFLKKIYIEKKIEKSNEKLALGLLVMTIAFFFGWLTNNQINSLVESSKINFNINNLYEVTLYSILGFFILGLFFLAFFQITAFFIFIFKEQSISYRSVFFLIIIATTLFVIAGYFDGKRDLVTLLWPTGIIILCLNIEFFKSKLHQLINTITILIAFSFITGYLIDKYSNEKEKSEQLLLAEKLSVNDDPVTEFLFSKIEDQILNDDSLNKALLFPNKYTNHYIEETLLKKYLTGYWNKYQITTHIFTKEGDSWGKLSFQKPKTIEELDTIIIKHGTKASSSKHLYHIYNKGNLLSYMTKLPMNKGGSNCAIIIEFTSKVLTGGAGFPELLIENTTSTFNYLKKYSSARYIDSRLISKEGDYPYSLVAGVFEEQNENIFTSKINGYNHLIYRVDRNTFVIVSKKIASYYEQFTRYSYFFLFFGLMFIAGSFCSNYFAKKSVWVFGLSKKIQSTLVLFGITSLLVFGFAIRYIIIQQNEIKNKKLVQEKTMSILLELKERLDAEEQLNYNLSDYLDGLLSKWSQVFFTDINLFDLSGRLISTSQPKIYNEGLLATKINPIALFKLSKENKSEFFQNENIGKLKYLSAYMPLRNNLNHVIGYLNLPYFARQNELEQELSQILVAIINVFFLLIILSILAALFVTEWITKPLVFIKEGLLKIELNKANEPIKYRQNDEIGELVSAYNKKVVALEMKAEQLAKSEREGAWKEMAKQVAHEIKNPLTPMKLSVQLLQKAWRDNAPDFNERIAKHSEMLVQQIDALSNIAEEFSNFAKMPIANNEIIDLPPLIKSVIELHKGECSYSISFETSLPEKQFINGDKEQLIRVLNNLIKNAIQAINPEVKGEIICKLEKVENKFQLSIIDNGVGIAEIDQEKIFSPNFTTKTSGSGLGLSMVKNIIETAGGSIWFETEYNKGTTFFILLPAIKD